MGVTPRQSMPAEHPPAGTLHHVELWVPYLAFHAGDAARVDAVYRQAPEHGWTPLFPEAYPHAGGPAHYAAYLANSDGDEVELVGTVGSDP